MRRLGLASALALALACGGPSAGGERGGEPAVFDQLGGVDGLRAIVDAWIGEATSDPRIRDFFVDADIARLELHLVELTCVAVGGPCAYRGRDLEDVHSGMALDAAAMTAFLDDLDRVLVERRTPARAREVLLERIRGIADELIAGG